MRKVPTDEPQFDSIQGRELPVEWPAIEPGHHRGTIREVESPIALRIRPDTFRIRIALQVGDAVIYTFVFGSLSAMDMIYFARDYYVGKSVVIVAKHVDIGQRRYLQAHITTWS